VAEEGGFDLGRYPAVERWLERVAAEPGYLPMKA
jgi:glutathione S-transferase